MGSRSPLSIQAAAQLPMSTLRGFVKMTETGMWQLFDSNHLETAELVSLDAAGSIQESRIFVCMFVVDCDSIS